MTDRIDIPPIKFGTGTRVRFKVLEVSLENPNQMMLFEGRFAGMLTDPKAAPIPMYSFYMDEDTENAYIKLVPVQALIYMDILDLEEFTPEDDKAIKDRLEGDPTSYA